MGSMFTESSFPNELRNKFILVFSKLKQRILWKTDENVDWFINNNISSNVMLQSWLPQQDILGIYTFYQVSFYINCNIILYLYLTLAYRTQKYSFIHKSWWNSVLFWSSLSWGPFSSISNIRRSRYEW